MRFVALATALAGLMIAGCKTPTYEGLSYDVNLRSEPSGATLYLIPRRNWLKVAEPRLEQDLERWRVKENNGVSPVDGYSVLDYRHTLVGKLGDQVGELELKPTKHGETFTVYLSTR